MLEDVARRVAIVTGANRGLGFEIARQLVARGLVVVATARDPQSALAAAAELDTGGGVVGLGLDVTEQVSVEGLIDDVLLELGGIDVLVNNAGVGPDYDKRVETADLGEVRETLETNLFGTWRMCRAVLPAMRDAGYGRIVNLSSELGAPRGIRGAMPGYRVSKAAVNGLTRTLAAELRGTNVLVNAACPGWVHTDMGGPRAPRSVELGADTPVWLATLPDGGPAGGFFKDKHPILW